MYALRAVQMQISDQKYFFYRSFTLNANFYASSLAFS